MQRRKCYQEYSVVYFSISSDWIYYGQRLCYSQMKLRILISFPHFILLTLWANLEGLEKLKTNPLSPNTCFKKMECTQCLLKILEQKMKRVSDEGVANKSVLRRKFRSLGNPFLKPKGSSDSGRVVIAKISFYTHFYRFPVEAEIPKAALSVPNSPMVHQRKFSGKRYSPIHYLTEEKFSSGELPPDSPSKVRQPFHRTFSDTM